MKKKIKMFCSNFKKKKKYACIVTIPCLNGIQNMNIWKYCALYLRQRLNSSMTNYGNDNMVCLSPYID